MRRAHGMHMRRNLANRKPRLWNVVRTTWGGTDDEPAWTDKVIARNLTELQAVTLIHKVERRTSLVTYSGQCVGHPNHTLIA